MILFETDRLVARRLTHDDASAMVEIYGDRDAMRYVGDGEPLDLEACRHWVDVTDGNFERRGYGMVALIERSTGVMVGCVGIVHPDQQPDPEVKYAFRRDAWGRGFATEAVRGLIEWGRSQFSLPYLIATTAPGNEPSHRVLGKAGFVRHSVREDEDGTTFVWRLDCSAP